MPTVVVTGANRGIGLAFCQAFKDREDKVIGLCRSESPELKALGIKVVEGVEVTDRDTLQALAKSWQHGHIDLLINNAGVFKNETLSHLNYESIDIQLQTNAIAPLKVTEAFLPHLKSGSKVAMITSRMGSIQDNTSGAYYGYRMSKAALNAAAKSLSLDLSPREVAVGIYHPGFVKTQMTHGAGDLTPKESVQGLVKQIDKLNLENSGGFWHTSGEMLPW